MNAELKYNGYTAQPSDYECQDGDLAAVLNLMPEKGALHPFSGPVPVINRKNGTGKVLYIHETNTFKHPILIDDDGQTLRWMPNYTKEPRMLQSLNSNVIQVTSVGNTLVVLAEDGLHYYLWKIDDDEDIDDREDFYQVLGTKLPELDLSFGLQGEFIEGDVVTVNLAENEPYYAMVRDYAEWKENNQRVVTDSVLASVNKFIADNATNAGKFMMPFFVRYAYRLFDDTLAMHSAPILMLCANDTNPMVAINDEQVIRGGSNYSEATGLRYRLMGVAHQLDFAALSLSQISQVKNTWKDIIKSVDIFVSAPLYVYDYNGMCKQLAHFTEENWYCVCKMTNQDTSLYPTSTYPIVYQKNTLRRMMTMSGLHNTGNYMEWKIDIPRKSAEIFADTIKNNSSFYFLKSIDPQELTTDRNVIDVPNDYLPSLVTREAMTDDYDSHCTLLPGNSFVYNQKLHLCNLRKRLFSGYHSQSIFCYSNGFVKSAEGSPANPTEFNQTWYVRVYIYIRKNGREFVLNPTGTYVGYNFPVTYYYYPDTDAYKVRVTVGTSQYEENLIHHDFLNGSQFFNSWAHMDSASYTIPTLFEDPVFDIANKIYASQLGNPFYYPLLGIITVGTGRIIGISTAAKALSEGQFGQFPLYAFTTDGVWAMEISSTGGISARQPITRDVCINADSITQIDSAVLFATDRGIMLLSGSNAQCITDVVDNNEEPFIFTQFPLASNIETLLETTGTGAFPEQPFRNFLLGCQMLYSYNRQFIIVFNPAYAYAYVYSLEYKTWGLIQSNIVNRIPSYPEALAYTSDRKTVDFSLEGDVLEHQFLVTRPLKLDPSLKDVHKTIDTIITRGNFTRGHVKTVLYGSRDLRSWFPIYTSVDHFLRHFRGTPYKYFRIALICSLTHDESIWGSSIQYTPKLTNQPR